LVWYSAGILSRGLSSAVTCDHLAARWEIVKMSDLELGINQIAWMPLSTGDRSDGAS